MIEGCRVFVNDESAPTRIERIEKRKQLFKGLAEVSWAQSEVTTYDTGKQG